jgi:glycosyltransferase involved in cell wall biosynthesis
MRLSIVTVCRNAAATIEGAVRSVTGQTHPDVEHIVIDGASTDGTLEKLGPYRDRLAKLVSERDAGLYDAMNKGLAAASGEYVGYLNADDYYAHPGVLARIASTLETAKCDAAYGDLVYIRPDRTDHVVRYWKSRPFRPGLVEGGWMPAHPTFFVRTELLRRAGGFDTRYRYQADYELMVRLFLKERISSIHIPEILVCMRTGGHSNRSIRNVYRGNIEAYQACVRNGVPVTRLFMLRKVLSRVPQFFRARPSLPARPGWP